MDIETIGKILSIIFIFMGIMMFFKTFNPLPAIFGMLASVAVVYISKTIKNSGNLSTDFDASMNSEGFNEKLNASTFDANTAIQNTPHNIQADGGADIIIICLICAFLIMVAVVIYVGIYQGKKRNTDDANNVASEREDNRAEEILNRLSELNRQEERTYQQEYQSAKETEKKLKKVKEKISSKISKEKKDEVISATMITPKKTSKRKL